MIDIPDPVDLAVIVFPSAVCNRALEQCGEIGIKSVMIISAGFKEIGGKGLEREKELITVVGSSVSDFTLPTHQHYSTPLSDPWG